MEADECSFCFVCLKGLRGRKGQYGGDETQEVGKGSENEQTNSIKILMTYLLNTADNKYDSVLKGILRLTGVNRHSDDPDHNDDGGEGVEAGDEQDGLEGTPKSLRKCFRMCHQCEVVAGRILELHLELEKVQMKLVQEARTMRETILRSSGWLGGTCQGMMNESEEAFENFARRFLDGDLTTKARGTFGLLKTFQTAVADIDKTAILVPLVYLDRCAITTTTENFDLSVATGSLKTEPNDEDNVMELEPFQENAVHSISFDPEYPDPGYSLSDDNNDSDFNRDPFVSSLEEEDILNPLHAPMTPAQAPEDIPSWIPTRITIKRGIGRQLGGKNRKRVKHGPGLNCYTQSQSTNPDQLTETRTGRPPVVKQEFFGNLLGSSEVVVAGGSSNISIGSWNPVDDEENLHDEDKGEETGSMSFSTQATESQRRGPLGNKRRKKKGMAPKGWSRPKNSAYRRQLQLIITRPPSPLPQRRSQVKQQPQPYRKTRPKPKPKPKPVSTGRKISTPRSPSEFYPDFDPDEDIEFESAPTEDVKDSDFIPGEKKRRKKKKKPYKKKTHSERLVQSAKQRRGHQSVAKSIGPPKRKSQKNDDVTREKNKGGRPILGEGPNPVPRVGRRFVCETCNFLTRDIYRMEQHLRGHETEEKVFKCEPCNLCFSNEQHYRLHEGRHRGHNRVRCEVDGCHRHLTIFQIGDHLKSHEMVDKIIPCSYCTHFLPSLGMHLAHLRRYHADVEWKCLVCGEIFQKMTELGDHLQGAHQALEKVNCSYEDCDRNFYDPESLRIHKKIHKKEFGCTQCDRTFGTQAFFDFHQEFHRTGKPYKCDLDNCSEAFPDHASLRKHKVEIHQFEKQVCEMCGKEFRNSSYLKGHMITNHGIGDGKPCPVCNKLFASAQPLRVHVEQFHSTAKNYVCEECGKAFNTMKKCRSHKIMHGERKCQCPHCPMAFRQRLALRDHIYIHTGEKPYPCRICGRGFRQGSTRNKHESVCPLSSSKRQKTEEKMDGEHDNDDDDNPDQGQ